MRSSYSETELIRSVCRESFEDFVRIFWEDVPGAGELIWNWHIGVFCRELQEIAERVFARKPKAYDLVVNVSPGTSKSTVFSILFQPWTWTRMPHARHLHASHTDNLVLDLATKARAVIKSEKYRRCFPEIELRADQDTKSYFANTLGGDRLTCTVGGKSPMGFHAHFLGMDDPIDPKKAVSEIELKNARDFTNNILPTRKVDKAVSVTWLIMQRLDREDPTAVMLERAKIQDAGSVRHICLPAELSERVHPPGLREHYIDGLMDPVRLPLSVLKEYKANLGAYGYAGQFEQWPIPLGGGMFKPQYFNNRVKAAPYHAKRIRYWDRASTADGGCYTAGVLMAKSDDGNYYVEHVVHGQWEPDERNQIIRATALRDRSRYGPRNDPAIYVEAEGGSSGRDAWKAVARALAGFVVKEDSVTGSKDARAEPWSCQLAAGNVHIVEDGTWDVNNYVQEHLLFRPEPGKRLGKYKDQVDGSSGAFNLLANARLAGTVRTYTAKSNSKLPRIAVCSRDELANLVIDDHRTLLISLTDPPPKGRQEPPLHALGKLLDSTTLAFADMQPADYQDRWQDLIPPYDEPAERLVMRPEDGKKLWSFVLRKRDPSPEVYVIQDEGDRRAMSLALALADMLRLPRNTCIYRVADEDWKATAEDKPPNAHIYATVKASRSMVL